MHIICTNACVRACVRACLHACMHAYTCGHRRPCGQDSKQLSGILPCNTCTGHNINTNLYLHTNKERVRIQAIQSPHLAVRHREQHGIVPPSSSTLPQKSHVTLPTPLSLAGCPRACAAGAATPRAPAPAAAAAGRVLCGRGGVVGALSGSDDRKEGWWWRGREGLLGDVGFVFVLCMGLVAGLFAENGLRVGLRERP